MYGPVHEILRGNHTEFWLSLEVSPRDQWSRLILRAMTKTLYYNLFIRYSLLLIPGILWDWAKNVELSVVRGNLIVT